MILTVFGSIVVAIMMASYWLEPRSRWYVLVFALAHRSTAGCQRCTPSRSLKRYGL